MKRNVRIFSMLLALICVMATIPVMTVSASSADLSAYADGATYTAPDDTVYTVVKSLDELNKHTTMSGNLILGADIDYTNQKHTAINLNGYILDGNGYAMYGINVVGSGDMGLFTKSTSGTIRNLSIGLPDREITMEGTGSGKSSGVLVGYMSNSALTVDHVNIYANITTSKNTVGGFVGNIGAGANLTITNSCFYGSMSDTAGNPSGGFVGKIGGAATVTITNCVNYGAVSNTANTGGFIGELYLSAVSATATITNCVNAGNITGGNTSGFVGSQSGSNNTATLPIVNIEGCLNTGHIQGTRATGFVSWIGQKWFELTLKNSVNLGTIHATGADGASGLIGRFVGGLSIDTCGSFGAITASDTNFGVIATDTGWTPKKVEKLHYAELTNAKDLEKIGGYTGSTSMSIAEGIAWTNELLGDVLGDVILNADGTGAVLADPTFVGVQKSNSTAGKIRLVATLNDSLRYSAVGFEVALEGGNTITKECNSVYEKLLSTNDQGFASEVNAADLYGRYLYALAIENIPTTGNVTLTVTPYGKDLNGTTVYSGDSYQLVFVDGALTSVSACA